MAEDFNADLLSRLKANWPDVHVVDQYSALDNVADMSPLAIDSVGLHPNTSGYLKMANTWRAAIDAAGAVSNCAS